MASTEAPTKRNIFQRFWHWLHWKSITYWDEHFFDVTNRYEPRNPEARLIRFTYRFNCGACWGLYWFGSRDGVDA